MRVYHLERFSSVALGSDLGSDLSPELRSDLGPELSPELGSDFALHFEYGCGGLLHRDLYYAIGEVNFWWERRLWSSSDWLLLSNNSSIELWVLYSGGVIAGYFELDLTFSPIGEVSFFGLSGDYIGRGLGKVLLSCALDRLVESGCTTQRLNTCTLDDVRALPLYRSFGFDIVREEVCDIEDPRTLGILPADLPLPENYLQTLNNEEKTP